MKRIKEYHGLSKSLTYKVWVGIKGRCKNKNNSNYKNYGERGIVLCKEWEFFSNFLKDMGMKPDHWSIERINNNGNYEKVNCKWIPISEQYLNSRRNYYTYHG